MKVKRGHKLKPSPRMTRYMHAHKNMEEGMCDIFNIVTRTWVPHQAALNVMADLYDGVPCGVLRRRI